MIDNILTVDRLSVRFGAATVVDDVSFAVARGESFGLVGESGSGKSTILRTIMGLNQDWSGAIGVNGVPARGTGRSEFSRQVQMVFQDPYASLHPRHLVGNAIAEPMRIHRLDNVEGRTLDLLRLIGLSEDFAYRYPHELSGGQRQRIAIARALALSPKLLLLDEPTSALDVSIQAEILNLLNRLRSEMGLTFVIVSHNLAVISYICDRLMLLQNARHVETLTREQLRSRDLQQNYTREFVAASGS
ncbi:ABC transporter ATP-binding protein [Devosia sp.]|uniref:ABC transporter ATP-binding protein n=1 Tax=Devosia sp. TaxID=1871048 RepID=UPI001AC2D40C|nr:ABC transporter ATP-binding protein [Devosia sp.]MBN9335555.1 ABC transporter ATP-binding protein [Devosia sp.]